MLFVKRKRKRKREKNQNKNTFATFIWQRFSWLCCCRTTHRECFAYFVDGFTSVLSLLTRLIEGIYELYFIDGDNTNCVLFKQRNARGVFNSRCRIDCPMPTEWSSERDAVDKIQLNAKLLSPNRVQLQLWFESFWNVRPTGICEWIAQLPGKWPAIIQHRRFRRQIFSRIAISHWSSMICWADCTQCLAHFVHFSHSITHFPHWLDSRGHSNCRFLYIEIIQIVNDHRRQMLFSRFFSFSLRLSLSLSPSLVLNFLFCCCEFCW